MTFLSKTQTFEVTSGAIHATDPCYDLDIWCAGTIDNVLNGTWEAHVTHDDEDYVASITVRHKDACKDEPALPFSRIPQVFAVDSGQFGFFDLGRFTDERGEGFYEDVCDLTAPVNDKGDELQQTKFTFRGFGIVTRSGFGDGRYPVYATRDPQGRVIAMKVVFLPDEVEDQEADMHT